MVQVHRSPTCACCEQYERYLVAEGFSVRTVLEEDASAFKADRGVPEPLWSCHTSLVGGYVVEGHVPAEALGDLLEERPAIRGLALPGMPEGAPGMPGTRTTLVVYAFGRSGVEEFGRY